MLKKPEMNSGSLPYFKIDDGLVSGGKILKYTFEQQ
jgi:hypothetical protein